jgi:hypothetical protein
MDDPTLKTSSGPIARETFVTLAGTNSITRQRA